MRQTLGLFAAYHHASFTLRVLGQTGVQQGPTNHQSCTVILISFVCSLTIGKVYSTATTPSKSPAATAAVKCWYMLEPCDLSPSRLWCRRHRMAAAVSCALTFGASCCTRVPNRITFWVLSNSSYPGNLGCATAAYTASRHSCQSGCMGAKELSVSTATLWFVPVVANASVDLALR